MQVGVTVVVEADVPVVTFAQALTAAGLFVTNTSRGLVVSRNEPAAPPSPPPAITYVAGAK